MPRARGKCPQTTIGVPRRLIPRLNAIRDREGYASKAVVIERALELLEAKAEAELRGGRNMTGDTPAAECINTQATEQPQAVDRWHAAKQQTKRHRLNISRRTPPARDPTGFFPKGARA